MRCPRCAAEGIDAAGYCVNCRLYRGTTTAPQPMAPPAPPQPSGYPQPSPPPQLSSPAQPSAYPQAPGTRQQPPTAAMPPVARPPVQPPVGAVPFAAPPMPPPGRNPLLIPGIIFGVVCVLLAGAVIVYAATSGGDHTSPTNPVAMATPPASAAAPSPSITASDTAGAPPAADDSAQPSAGASPSPSSADCIVGVWLEERHDEQVTVIDTGTFPFTGGGAYHRYNDSGRVVVDYGNDGVHLHGSNGSIQYDYVFSGLITYQYKVENGIVTYSSPHPDGTETFIRNGHTDYSGPLEPRIPPPMRVNCGPVAMSLTNDTTTIQLKRTSPAP